VAGRQTLYGDRNRAAHEADPKTLASGIKEMQDGMVKDMLTLLFRTYNADVADDLLPLSV
jgi:hypothetical protein